MKNLIITLVLITAFFLNGCGTSPLIPLTPSPTATATTAPTATATLTSTATATLIPTSTPWYNSCPVDMSLPDVSITSLYSLQHLGLDIKAPEGTQIRSPCTAIVYEVFIDSTGGNATHFSCAEYPGHMIEMGHFDFTLGDTIAFYQLPKRYFSNGKTVPNSFGFNPDMVFAIGDPMHFFISDSGAAKEGSYHVHITDWTKETSSSKWEPYNDPLKLFNCAQ
jgi:hypothetical protein